MNFRFLSIPVFVQPIFWVFLLIFCFIPEIEIWQMCLLGIVLFFSLLFHEYGHALVAYKYGRQPQITLEGFGGYASYDGRGLSEKQQFFITLAGPLFTALLIALSYFVLKNWILDSIFLSYFFYYTFRLNIYWLIVNLCPLEPLDGGKLASYLLRKCFGENTGRKWCLVIGNIVAAAGASYFLINKSYFFAYVFLFHGWKNFQAFAAEYMNRKPSAFNLYNTSLNLVEKGDVGKAKSILSKLVRSKDHYIKIHSSELLAKIYIDEGLKREAYELLDKVGVENLGRGKCLFLKLAYDQGKLELFNRFAREIYDLEPTFDTALLNAMAFSQLKNPSYAVGWLHTALQFGDSRLILDDPAFIPINDYPEFIKIAEELSSVHK